MFKYNGKLCEKLNLLLQDISERCGGISRDTAIDYFMIVAFDSLDVDNFFQDIEELHENCSSEN